MARNGIHSSLPYHKCKTIVSPSCYFYHFTNATVPFFHSLVSIQGLILGVEHPYYLEPGYGGWEASHANTASTMAHGGPPPAASSGTAKGGAVDGSSGVAQKYIPPSVKTYEDKIRMGTLKHAIGDYCTEITKSKSSARASTSTQHYLSAFEDILQAHFWSKACLIFLL